MADAIALFNPDVIAGLEKLANSLSQSTLMPDALRGKPRDILVTLMTGAELGLGPMQSVRGINVIRGKASLSADLMVALCQRHKDVCKELRLIEEKDTVATYTAQRVGEAAPTVMSFTMQDAQKAGLANSDMYRKFPKVMLRARCASKICKAVFPDLCMGLYDADSNELDQPEEKDVTPTAVHVQSDDEKKESWKPRGASQATLDKRAEMLNLAKLKMPDGTEHVIALPKEQPPETVDKVTGEVVDAKPVREEEITADGKFGMVIPKYWGHFAGKHMSELTNNERWQLGNMLRAAIDNPKTLPKSKKTAQDLLDNIGEVRAALGEERDAAEAAK